MKPGLHIGVDEAAYHADPADQPSLSCSVARLLLERTARRAQFAHPRLNPEPVARTPSQVMGEGTVLHALVLGTPCPAAVVQADSYRTKAAKAARDTALAAGQVPVLADRWPDLVRIAAEAREAIAAVPELRGMLSPDAVSEAVLIWDDDGVTCRCRVDRMRPNGPPRTPMWDLKFTERTDPLGAWDRRMVTDAFDLRAAWYARGHRAVFGQDAPYCYVVVETEAPVDVLPIQCTPEMLALGESKVETALDLWRQCMRTGRFDGYRRRVHHISPPAWAERAWNDAMSLREHATAAAVTDGR